MSSIFDRGPRRRGKRRTASPRRRSLRFEHVEARRLLAAEINIGVARSDSGSNTLTQFLDTQSLAGRGAGDETHEIQFEFGLETGAAGAGPVDDVVVAGDLSGVGFDQVVAVRQNGVELQWYADTDRDTDEEYLFRFGDAGDIPLIADMNGDGIDDVIVVDTATTSNLLEWEIRYGVAGALPFPTDDSLLTADATFSFGVDADHPAAGGGVADIPLVGDIDNDGTADVLVYRQNGTTFDVYVDDHTAAYPNNVSTVLTSNPAISTDFLIAYVPVVGDWDNTGGDN